MLALGLVGWGFEREDEVGYLEGGIIGCEVPLEGES